MCKPSSRREEDYTEWYDMRPRMRFMNKSILSLSITDVTLVNGGDGGDHDDDGDHPMEEWLMDGFPEVFEVDEQLQLIYLIWRVMKHLLNHSCN